MNGGGGEGAPTQDAANHGDDDDASWMDKEGKTAVLSSCSKQDNLFAKTLLLLCQHLTAALLSVCGGDDLYKLDTSSSSKRKENHTKQSLHFHRLKPSASKDLRVESPESGADGGNGGLTQRVDRSRCSKKQLVRNGSSVALLTARPATKACEAHTVNGDDGDPSFHCVSFEEIVRRDLIFTQLHKEQISSFHLPSIDELKSCIGILSADSECSAVSATTNADHVSPTAKSQQMSSLRELLLSTHGEAVMGRLRYMLSNPTLKNHLSEEQLARNSQKRENPSVINPSKDIAGNGDPGTANGANFVVSDVKLRPPWHHHMKTMLDKCGFEKDRAIVKVSELVGCYSCRSLSPWSDPVEFAGAWVA